MLNLIVSGLVLVAVAVREWATSKGRVKWLIIVICAGAIYTTIDSYREGEKRAGQLEKIGHVEDTVNALRFQARALDTTLDTLKRAVNALVVRRDTLSYQIGALSTQHDSLIVQISQLQAMGRTQLSGELIHIPVGSKRTPAGLIERIDQFKSRWVQPLQDLSIFVKFNRQFERVTVAEGFPSGLQIHGCPDIDTSIIADTFGYPCDFLEKGHWIEVRVYSRHALEIDSIHLMPTANIQ